MSAVPGTVSTDAARSTELELEPEREMKELRPGNAILTSAPAFSAAEPDRPLR